MAAELRTSDSTANRYGSGRYRPQWPAVPALLDFYRATGADRARAAVLWVEAVMPTPQIRLPASTPEVFEEFIRVEREAAVIRHTAPTAVPGLPQIADYARAIRAAAARTLVGTASEEDFVTTRLSKQKPLEPPERVRLHALLDEMVTRRLVGGPAVVHAQLQHLLRMSGKENVRIQVSPADAGAYGSMSGACTTFGYDEPEDVPVVSLEHGAGGVWVEDGDDVRHLGHVR